VGEASLVGVRDGVTAEAVGGGDILTGAIVEVGWEAIPQNCESRSVFEAEYSVDSVEKFSEISGCLTVPSGHR
jgi:hypothetical protein